MKDRKTSRDKAPTVQHPFAGQVQVFWARCLRPLLRVVPTDWRWLSDPSLDAFVHWCSFFVALKSDYSVSANRIDGNILTFLLINECLGLLCSHSLEYAQKPFNMQLTIFRQIAA